MGDQTSDKLVFYLNETWLNQNHIRTYIRVWRDSHENDSLRVYLHKKRRFTQEAYKAGYTSFTVPLQVQSH